MGMTRKPTYSTTPCYDVPAGRADLVVVTREDENLEDSIEDGPVYVPLQQVPDLLLDLWLRENDFSPYNKEA